MKKFKVEFALLSGTSTEITVEASSEDEAKAKASDTLNIWNRSVKQYNRNNYMITFNVTEIKEEPTRLFKVDNVGHDIIIEPAGRGIEDDYKVTWLEDGIAIGQPEYMSKDAIEFQYDVKLDEGSDDIDFGYDNVKPIKPDDIQF